MSIKELRKSTNLSQKDFANKFHLSIRTLQRWEQGQTETPEYIIFMIKTILMSESKGKEKKYKNVK